MLKKLIVTLFTLMLILCVLCSCDNASRPSDGTTSAGSVSSSDTNAESNTTGQLTYRIMTADLGRYAVVRSEDATQAEIDASRTVYNALKDYDGISIKTDFIMKDATNSKYTEEPYEILIGTTNRAETQAFAGKMRSKDYGYTVIGTKIVIAGGSPDATAAAVEAFVENVINVKHDDGVFLSSDNMFSVTGSYAVESLTLAGADISDYRIVYKSSGSSAKSLALSLQQDIEDMTGYTLSAVSDREAYSGGREILVGQTSRDVGGLYARELGDNGYYIGTHGEFVVLFGNTPIGLMTAVNSLSKSIRALPGNGAKATLDVPETIATVSESDKMTSMSFNLKVNPRTNERDGRVIKMILDYMPDTLGVQEASPGWMSLLVAKLTPYYNYVGEGRDGGNSGEYNAVFYRKDKFTLLEYGTKWLSDTPSSPSRYSESSLNRIYTYAKLKRNSDGAEFLHINTHLEHTSGEARIKQVAVLNDFITQNSGIPMIMSGDFNCTYSSEPYNAIIATGFSDSAKIALQTESVSTFHNYGSSDKTLDYFFIDAIHISVERYHVCNEKINGDYASDHHPIIIEYYIVN